MENDFQDNKSQQEKKVLELNAAMQGALRFDEPVNIKINGRFKGSLDARGQLLIAEESKVVANITAEDISILGFVTGNIKAKKRILLEENSKVIGDIESPILVIKEGAVLEGRVKMIDSFNEITEKDKDECMSSDELAKYLEVDKSKISEWANDGMLPGILEEGEWIFEKAKVDQWVSQGRVKE